MPFDLTSESALTLSQAAKLVPSYRAGRPTHVSRLVRWITNGVRTDDGRLVKLEALRLGGQWVTSALAIQRFAEAMTPSEADIHSPSQNTASRRKAAERASRELDAIGI